METDGLLYILCLFICEVIIIIIIVIIIIVIIIIYLFILEQLRYQTTELNRHLRRRLLTWLIVKLCFFFSLQGLINMKLYDQQLYANVEDLTV